MSAPLLQARGLCKRFGGLHAVSDLDLDVHAGEVVGVIGPNGAGKTTTFNMIAGAFEPTSGQLAFDGRSLAGVPTHGFAPRGIVRTFQHNKSFDSLSVRENVMVGMHTRMPASLWRVLAGTPDSHRAEREAQRRADELVDFVGLGEFAQAEVSTLSFGQGRLLEIARGLAAGPRLMLFDEPAAGLAPGECARLEEIILGIARQGIAVLLIEHDMRFLMALADRVAVLNFGRKIADGTPDAVRADPAVIEAYLGNMENLAHA
ncbi:ABC transporter ATP-binding protein [Pigmentiphaga kullae]|uniref:Branched-chain amino acid transport system ATP-binding protein n=1 Tax=Pigmentiphaga kullae TaxID=151784 RepID=A0A4Q7NJP3_9BURK|nr:ABC transporter ATP-binding protein [Pigmentiphaga kullae]RZS85128.1 branched-chain amino acid transport system ATP-binding protein [Pigmentiphaga kullae]